MVEDYKYPEELREEEYKKIAKKMKQFPYLTQRKTIYKYNPDYGDDRVCKCGHIYYRHFDSFPNMDGELMEPIGCKYCQCGRFIEEKE